MIDIEQPAMALNDVRDSTPAQMWNTWYVQPSDPREHIIQWVAHISRNTTADGKLKNIVFCCQGRPGFLEIGEGFNRDHVHLFSNWTGLVETIWIRACQFSHFPKSITRAMGDGGVFCSEIAQAAQCQVVASMDTLYIGAGKPLPYGELDGFEALVLSFAPDGTVSKWSDHYKYYEQSVERLKTGALK